MNKKSQMIDLKQINKFQSIPISPFSTNEMLQRIERNMIDTKQSDFIKRLKKSKSIMIAQKNRKQKNVLNSYFMDSRKHKNVDIITKNQSFTESSAKNNLSKSQNQHQLQRLLFPSVHNSIKNCFNNVKKLKSKQIRLQGLHQPLDVGAYLQQKNIHKNLNRITIAVKQRQEYEYLKYQKNKKNKIQSQRQFERQKINFTQTKGSPKPIYLYKSQKRLNQARFFKYNKKYQKYARNYTQQSKPLKPQHENFGGWEFKKEEEQLIIDKDYF